MSLKTYNHYTISIRLYLEKWSFLINMICKQILILSVLFSIFIIQIFIHSIPKKFMKNFNWLFFLFLKWQNHGWISNWNFSLHHIFKCYILVTTFSNKLFHSQFHPLYSRWDYRNLKPDVICWSCFRASRILHLHA